MMRASRQNKQHNNKNNNERKRNRKQNSIQNSRQPTIDGAVSMYNMYVFILPYFYF